MSFHRDRSPVSAARNGAHREPAQIPARDMGAPAQTHSPPAVPSPPGRYGKLADVAAFTGLSERTIRRHTKPRGTLPCIRLGSKTGVVYDFDDVIRWMTSLKT